MVCVLVPTPAIGSAIWMEHPHLRVQCRFLVEFEWLEEEFKWYESADTENGLPACFKTHRLPMRCIGRLTDLRLF